MPAYSFSVPRFYNAIPEGGKVRTTRMMRKGKGYAQAQKAMARKVPVRLYWKMRTKQCKLLMEAPLVEVATVEMAPNAKDEDAPTLWEIQRDMLLFIEGVPMTWAERNAYACEEGFDGNDALTPWGQFIDCLVELHGTDFWQHKMYTVKWKPQAGTVPGDTMVSGRDKVEGACE